jgi:hypothetical protein
MRSRPAPPAKCASQLAEHDLAMPSERLWRDNPSTSQCPPMSPDTGEPELLHELERHRDPSSTRRRASRTSATMRAIGVKGRSSRMVAASVSIGL